MKTLLKILFVCFFTNNLFAQYGGSIGSVDARATGLANTYTVTSGGVYSIGINPANLLLDKYNFQISTLIPFPNLSLNAGTNFLNIDEYNYYFGGVDINGETVGRPLTEDDKNHLKELFKDGGIINTNVVSQHLAFGFTINETVGAFSFGISDIISGRIKLPKEFVEIGMDGNPVGSVYNFNDTEGKAWWIRKYTLSYAKNLVEIKQNIFQKILTGISLNLISGYAYVGIDEVKTELTTTANNEIIGTGRYLAHSSFSDDFGVEYDFDSTAVKKDFEFSPFPKTAGNGFGFDIGVTAVMNDIWIFGIAVTDIGSIKWKKNTAVYEANAPIYLDDITDEAQTDSLTDAITGEGRYVGEFSTSLPTALRLGASFRLDKYLQGNFPGIMLLSFDYNQGFNDQPRNTTIPRFSLGSDWMPSHWFAFRTGFSFAGEEKFSWAAGIGFKFGFFEFNLASPNFQYVFSPNNAKRISVAMGSRLVF